MSNSELIQPELEVVELKNEPYNTIAAFLGRHPDNISEKFIEQFYNIRGDIRSVLPGQIAKHNKEKSLAQKDGKKGQVYNDPRTPKLPQEQQQELLKYTDLLKLQEGVVKIPEDILIRALMAIKNRAIAELEGRKSEIVGVSREQKQAEKEEKRIAKLHNWNHRR